MKYIKSKEIFEKSGWIKEKGYKKKILLDEQDLKRQGSVLQMNIVEPNTNLASHHHKKMTEAVYVLSGEASLVINGKDFFMRPGDIITIEPNEIHNGRNPSHNEFKYLVFKTNFSEEDTPSEEEEGQW